ncbi:hypothetical protein PR003_g20126 [Phytophthora rubi]|uniref:VWFA domain-containing protein n=1 Tax=Phytophthora rubi TaxID=129364 RepID=A0A6A4DPW8_9STRA|nr:hypothetical protein PR002_g22114 [Phytophthora rubi]KAE8999409.1 hypothetical protein PR001_g19061 [Phytophthora rubi]KAE9311009.1 hypothetical protein PR003_g20126 [Phytophthora rubi]
MFSSWRRSKSSLRADAAEAERAMLREKLQAMQFTNASATQSTETTTRSKSASSIRADAAEAELAKLRSQMQAKHKKKFLKFSCKIGWCTHEGTCDSVDADLELLKKRLTAMELEMEQLQRFSEIRNEMELNIAKVEKEIRSKYGILNALELVIVMDCTNSMSSWILLAKSAILSIINNVRLDHPRAKIRIGVVAYRDFCDGDKRLQTQTLTSDAKVVQNFISSLRAFGGGDDPEDIPGGLAAALAMPFQAEAKRIVLVTDAPCHGRKFHDTSDKEEYRSEIEQSPDICAQMREMASRGIDFTIIEVYPTNTAKMVVILHKEFNCVKSHDGFKREFQSVSLDNADDAARFESVVSSSASSSISTCKQRSSMEVVGREYGATRRPTARLSHVAEGDEEEEEALGEEAVVAPPTVKTLN